jgi:hypothetical protein
MEKKNSAIFFIFGAAVLIFVGYGWWQAVPDAGKAGEKLPKIEISPQFFDFGEAEYGQVLKYNFLIKNGGEAVLEIKRVATSCGCTTAQVSKKEIEPGDEAELLVIYDTGVMSRAHGKGRQERIIYIKSNDSVNPLVEVRIFAQIK